MKSEKGFLLLEVIISIVVITGGLLFIMRVYSASKSAIDRSCILFESGLLLEEKIFDFEEPCEIEKGQKNGEFEDRKSCRWDAVAEPASTDNTDLNVVTLSVSNQTAAYTAKHSLVTYLKNKTG